MTANDLPYWLPLSVAVWLVQMIAYHGIGLWFLWLDETGRMEFCRTRPRDRIPYRAILPRVLFNQVFILLPCMMAVQALGLAYAGPDHIGILIFLISLIGMTIGHDIVQYIAHAFILHRPSLMRKLGHSVHHSTTASCSISACYMSAADFFLEICCPYLIPLIVVGGGGADVIFHFFTVSVGAFGGLYEHSGYDFGLRFAEKSGPGLKGRINGMLAAWLSSRAHAEHHSRGNVSFSDGFGSSNICDTVFATRWDLVKPRERRNSPKGQEISQNLH